MIPAAEDEKSVTLAPARGVNLLTASAWTLVSQLTALVVGLVASIMTARALGAAGKGQLTLLGSMSPLIVTLLGLGLNYANAYFIGRRKRTVPQIVSDSLVVAVAVSAVGIPAGFLFARYALPALSGVPPTLIALATVPLPFALMHFYLTGMLIGLGRVKTIAIWNTVLSAVTMAIIATAYTIGALSVGVVLATNALTSISMVGVYLAVSRHVEGLLFVRPSLARVLEQSRYSAKAYASSISSYLERRQDAFLLGMLSTASNVGVYSVATAFAELLWQVPKSVANALMAKSMQLEEEPGARVAAQTARVAGLLMIALLAILYVVVPPLMGLVFGAQFTGATAAFFVLAPGTVVYGVGLILWNHLAAHDRLVPKVAVASMGMNLVANIVLIPRFGYMGAAVSSTVSYCFAGVSYLVYFGRFTGLPLRRAVVPTLEDLKLVLSLPAMLARAARSKRTSGSEM